MKRSTITAALAFSQIKAHASNIAVATSFSLSIFDWRAAVASFVGAALFHLLTPVVEHESELHKKNAARLSLANFVLAVCIGYVGGYLCAEYIAVNYSFTADYKVLLVLGLNVVIGAFWQVIGKIIATLTTRSV